MVIAAGLWIRSIGEHLATMEQVHVVTGGFYGVGDEVGRSYHEKRCQMARPSNIWHVLPVRDNQVCRPGTTLCFEIHPSYYIVDILHFSLYTWNCVLLLFKIKIKTSFEIFVHFWWGLPGMCFSLCYKIFGYTYDRMCLVGW